MGSAVKKVLKKVRKKGGKALVWLSVAFTVFAFVVMFTPLVNWMARPLVVEEDITKADLIVVLGGGAYRTGRLSDASLERLVRGLELYRGGYAPEVLLSGGTVPNSAVKVYRTVSGVNLGGGGVVAESEIMRNYALALGFPPEDLAVDAASTNTYGNIIATIGYMEERGYETVLVVTSATHMKRAMMIADRLGVEAMAAPVKDWPRYRKSPLQRLILLREVLWEYGAFVLYRAYDYI